MGARPMGPGGALKKMTNEFTTRKIEASGSLGGELKKKREEKKLSLKEASKRINVQAGYLEAIENDEYAYLPAPVYVINFLKAYSKLLDIDSVAFVKRYTTELEIRDSIKRQAAGRVKRFPFPFSVTPSRIKLLFIVAGAGLAIFYAGSRIYAITTPSKIHIIYPEHLTFETDRGSIMVRGNVTRSPALTVNGETVYIDDTGNFEEELFLSEGVNTFEFIAVSGFGKEEMSQLKIIFIPPEDSGEETEELHD